MTLYRRKLNEVEAEPCECGCDYVVVRDGAHEPVPSEGADVTIPARRYLEGISNAAHAEDSLKLADELAETLERALPYRLVQAALSKYLESRRGR